MAISGRAKNAVGHDKSTIPLTTGAPDKPETGAVQRDKRRHYNHWLALILVAASVASVCQ